MNTNGKYLLSFILAIAFFASLTSCASNDTSDNVVTETPTPTVTNNPPTPTPSQNPTIAQLRAKSANTDSPDDQTVAAISGKKIDVTLYTSDDQCQELIPEKVSVSSEQPMTEAISKIVEQQNTTDLSLSGYRINVNNTVATVDLRIAPESKRQVASLSSCEQFALFGSLRKTLISNAEWKIKEVRFTDRGKEIAF
ncbi:sporulation/spore germination protein [Cronbergia sp. UHCC 0137]|uniref:sporulation/spore germination protein n=1 Tax=Cronbergia sp. UHCC 0137 TaxID=3110239 RepID=UPI002B2149EF|nr:sporulation/spore germination protein [Cronbergia sp. UHCC 0137]MEA5617353.1 sporulation/spore germination protein [Cronbergia sp. UHCC 0137]